MKGIHTRYLWLCFFLLLVGHTFSFFELAQYRSSQERANTIRLLPLPPSINSILAGEFQGITADFLYLDIAATLGGRKSIKYTNEDWDAIEKMFATAIRLDPYFMPTFRSIQAYLPWNERAESANKLLMEVYNKRDWDWLPAFFIGFNNYFFLNEMKEASDYFFFAAEFENAPPMLATLGARLAAESGEDEIGIEFLKRLLKTKEAENERKMLEDRIIALRGQKEIKELIARYKADHGVNPPSLHDLVFLKYTNQLPNNPYYGNFFYQGGKVSFSPFSANEQEPLAP